MSIKFKSTDEIKVSGNNDSRQIVERQLCSSVKTR